MKEQPEGVGEGKGRKWPWEAAIALASVLLFARTVGFGWVYDDQMEIVRNAYAHSLGNLRLIFATTVWAGSGMETYLYRPVTVLSYALNHAASGLAPWSYHLVNVTLHAAVSVMVFRVGRGWGLTALAAGVGALLFAVHPVHVEVVANVAGRKDLLAAFFVLGMLMAHRRGVGSRAGSEAYGGWPWTATAALAYLAACLSKEVGAVGLLLLVAQDVYLAGGPRAIVGDARLRLPYSMYASVLVFYLAVRSSVTGGLSVPETFYYDNPLAAVGAASGLSTAVVVVGKGVALLMAPFTLSPDYSFNAIPVVTSPLDLRLWATVAGLGALVWVLATGRGRGTVLPMAVAWYGLALLPTANLVVRVGTIFGERLLYLPSVAFCLGAGAGLAWLIGRYRAEAGALAGVVVVALGLQSWRYTGVWTDDVSLFRWATAAVPASTKAHHKLGEELLRADDLGGALRSLSRALEIAPDNEFASVTMGQARTEVIQRYGSPALGGAEAATPPPDPDVLYTLGQRARELGDLARAEEYWTAALAAQADHGPSLADMGVLNLTRGDTLQALELLQGAVESRPSLVSGWFNLGRIHLAQGRLPDARHALERFLEEAGPRYPEQAAWARNVLAELERR